MTFRKLINSALPALVVTMLLAGCSSMESESVADHHVGPVGPTYPSMYYFEATVTPHTVTPPATVSLMVRVYDSNGNLVPNVPVYGAGPGAGSDTVATTGYDGIARFAMEINALTAELAGQVLWITFSVEDTTLTIPVQVAPSQAGNA